MLTIAVILNGICALGLFAIAGKYLAGPVPADYHAAIMASGGRPVDDSLRTVIGALYKVMGSAIVALAGGIIALSVFGVWADLFWAKATILGMVLATGAPATLTAFGVARATGVRTPWLPAAVLTVLGVIAFIVSVS